MGSVDLCNHAFGFYRTFTSQRIVGKVNENAWMASTGPKSTGARFLEKKRIFFLNFIGPVTPPWFLYRSEIMRRVFAEHLLARAVFAKSIKVLGWQPEATKSREQDVPKKKNVFFF